MRKLTETWNNFSELQVSLRHVERNMPEFIFFNLLRRRGLSVKEVFALTKQVLSPLLLAHSLFHYLMLCNC